MAKVAFEVDRQLLETSIKAAEANGPLKNFDELWIKTVEIYNKSGPPRAITKGVVYLRVKEWGIQTQTKGGRGRVAGVPLSAEQKAAMQAGRKANRGSRADKFKANPEIQVGFDELKKEVPPRFESLVTRLTEQGSMRAAVALKCLDCTVYQPTEIKLCSCRSCPLFAFRPYRQAAVNADGEVEQIDEEANEEVAA